jgi:hypothetical protein
MITAWLLAAHIAVLGYWLGAEFVINGTYRYVSYSSSMPFDERSRLMEHVMHVDQHVRYALVLQASLGLSLAALYGYVPGGGALAIAAGVFGATWLAFVEGVHRLRHKPIGKTLGAIDRVSRYVLMAILLATALGLIGAAWPLPLWLRWKLAMFAGVMMSGVGIRLALISHFHTWAIMARDGPTAATNLVIKRTYVRATSVLLLLWLFVAGIAILSVWKPM